MKCYDEAVKIKPDYVEAWVNKGAAFASLEDYKKAIECYDEAIKISPDYANAWFNKACSNARKGEIENALSDLEKAIRTGGEAYIKYARDEEDFKDIIKNPQFIRLLS